MIHQIWRLSEGGEGNLGLACTSEGLVLGRTPLIERQDGRFAVRERNEIERLLPKAYGAEIVAYRLMPGLTTVAAALSANDQGLARIAAVHLRLPDLPDHTARDGLEAEDRLIKYARDEGSGLSDWNPALHPRTGTPPNPGWFAATGGSTNESFPVRTAQNDDPTRRSDAAVSIGLDRVVLAPGERNDELQDLMEWIANADPKEAPAIRAEIKRHFYDVGDAAAGDALNGALSNVLIPGVQRKDRQKILDQIGPYAKSDDDEATEGLIDASLLLLGIFPPAAGAEGAIVASQAASEAWRLGWAARGIYFSERLGANLPPNFPVIDKWLDGIITSIKSIDLRAATYQSAERLTCRLNDYINKLIFFDPDELAFTTIKSSAIKGRVLSLAIPKGSMTAAQRAAIEAVRTRARAFGIDLIITEF